MIYLLTQMALALVLAGVFGGALGWILHRSTQDKERGNLKSVINRQQQQLSHLQSEIAMLTDDYDELQRQSHDEMIELREANQQIPYLSTNLEKSQLLVSQMLKKHDSKLRELTAQNQTLTEQLKNAEHNEQAFNKLQADLDIARRNLAATIAEASLDNGSENEQPADAVVSDQQDDATPPASRINDQSTANVTGFDSESGQSMDDSEPALPTPDVSTRSSSSSNSASLGDTQRVIHDIRNTSSWASTPLSALKNEVSQTPAAEKLPHNKPGPSASTRATVAGSELLDENLDDVHVVVDEDILGIDDFESDRDIDELADTTISLSDNELADMDNIEEFTQTVDNAPVIFLDADTSEAVTVDNLAPADQAPQQKIKTDTELELPELPDLPSDVFDVDPFDQVIEIGDDLQKELDDDEKDSESNAFDPVERHDDLQQLVGIDPLTEKALNDLGITSYAQLAKLKHHEIETIANALKIVPARIESDDWVGNARRQLEDVLEEL